MSGGHAAEVQVRTLSEGGVPVLSVSGEIDISNANALESAVDGVVASSPDRVVFDLGGLSFMDSAGIAVLVATAGKVASVHLRHPSPAVRRVIELTGLSALLVLES